MEDRAVTLESELTEARERIATLRDALAECGADRAEREKRLAETEGRLVIMGDMRDTARLAAEQAVEEAKRERHRADIERENAASDRLALATTRQTRDDALRDIENVRRQLCSVEDELRMLRLRKPIVPPGHPPFEQVAIYGNQIVALDANGLVWVTTGNLDYRERSSGGESPFLPFRPATKDDEVKT
jgi:predicted  nucleic acid-binding Zn-ribbon protein